MKIQTPRTIKFQLGYINKIVCYTYKNKIKKKKQKPSTVFFFFLASERCTIILPVYNWCQAQNKARSKWQPICGSAMSCRLCNCLGPQGRLTLLIWAWACHGVQSGPLHICTRWLGKLSRPLRAGGLAFVGTVPVAQWQMLGAIGVLIPPKSPETWQKSVGLKSQGKTGTSTLAFLGFFSVVSMALLFYTSVHRGYGRKIVIANS